MKSKNKNHKHDVSLICFPDCSGDFHGQMHCPNPFIESESVFVFIFLDFMNC